MTVKTLKPYPKYKDSGVSWIGMVPVGWVVSKVRNHFVITKRIAGRTGFDVISITQQGLRIKDIESNQGQMAKDYSKYQIVEPGDFAMNHMDLLTGYIGIASGYGVTSPDYRVFKLLDENANFSRYFLYIFQQAYERQIFYGLGKGAASKGRWRLPAIEFLNYDIPIPPRPEQDAIVAYLDDKTAKIDRLIGLYKREIELLKERRQAAIHQAVTRGLDDKVKLKDSGVSWIGMVPRGWEVIALKHVCKVNAPVSHITKYLKDDTLVTFLPMEKISIDGKIDCSQKEKYIDVKTGYSSFAKDDVIIAKITPCFENGKGACLDVLDTDIGFGTTELINLRPYNKIASRFLFYITMNKIFRIIGADHMTGSAGQKRVPAEFVKNYIIPLPPRPEQDAIVAYLDDQCAKVDAMIGKVQSKIGLLEEYRVRLISDVVTGKVRV